MTQSELWQRMEWLGSKVAARMPADSAVARAFAPIAAEHGDDWTPPVAMLTNAYNEFRKLPDAEQERVMNVWLPSLAYPTQEALWDDFAMQSGIVLRYCELSTDGERCFASPTHDIEEVYPLAVRVMVVEGTGKAETLDALRRITRMIETRWDEIAGGVEWIQEKSGSPEASITPLPGSVKGGLKLSPTAT